MSASTVVVMTQSKDHSVIKTGAIGLLGKKQLSISLMMLLQMMMKMQIMIKWGGLSRQIQYT